MEQLLCDLIGHEAWADAECWKALEAHSGALTDEIILKKLQHFHLTQRAFLATIRGDAFQFPRWEDLPDLSSLKQLVIRYHREVGSFLDKASEADLDRRLSLPWFQNPPVAVTVAQALAQVATHSHYHRAQIALRLKEIGCKPPLTDLITWYWKGRREAVWT